MNSLDVNLIQSLFEPTSSYTQRKKESTHELRYVYEQTADFIAQLNALGYKSNKHDMFKLRLKKKLC
jgi:hypothetical protein